MKLNGKLEAQIRQYLPESLQKSAELSSFLSAVDETYKKSGVSDDTDKEPFSITPMHNGTDTVDPYPFHLFTSILSHFPGGVLITNEKGNILSCNAKLLKKFEIVGSPVHFIGKSVGSLHELIRQNVLDTEGFDKNIVQISEEQKDVTTDIIETKNGLFFERDYAPVFHKKVLIAHLWTYKDITTRKKLLDQISKNEFTQRQVLRASLDAIVIVDERGFINFWNPEAEKMFEYSLEESIGARLSDTIKLQKKLALEGRRIEDYLMSETDNGKSSTSGLKVLSKHGKKMEVDVATVKMEYNGEAYFCAFIHDITDAIRTREQLRYQKQYTKEIINNIPADIAVFNLDHKYLYINPAGIKDEKLRKWMIGKDDFDYFRMKGLPNDKAVQRRSYFNQAVENKKRVQWVDEFDDKAGGKKYVLRNYAPFIDDDIIKFVFGYGIDITELRSTQVTLTNTLAEFRRVNDELERFAYIISHDLQEPLRMVKSFLQLLEKKINDKLDDTDKRYIYFATNGAERMKQLIQDLLEYSRIGGKKEEVTHVDCNEVIYDLRMVFDLKLAETKTTLEAAPLPVIMGMKQKITQLFQNLISNAIKYRKKDGLQNIINIGFEDKNGMWEFYVKDNGIGIDNKFYEKIFLIFQRLDHIKDEHSGTGIGLAICKKIIEQHKGKIWVDSEPGNGSTFYFEIPKIQSHG